MRRAIRAHLDSHQVSRVIYGAIIGLAVVLTLELHPPGVGAVIATLLGTAVAVGLADVYSEYLGFETRAHARPDRGRLGEIIGDALFVMLGIAFPVVFFLLSAAGALELGTAFTVAKWSGLGLIVFYGFCGARLAGAPVVRSVVEALAVGLIGGLLIALKALIH